MLIPKVEQRITQYLDYLEKNAYRAISGFEFEMYEPSPSTEGAPSAGGASSNGGKTWRSPPENVEWKKITTPAPWGREWTCTWFRAPFRAPSGSAPAFISVTPNSDSLAFIDGKPAGSFNMFHKKIRIDADGKDHILHIESYGGHFFGGCHPSEGKSVILNVGKHLPAYPNTFEGGFLLERLNAVHALFYDIRVLYETAKIADPNSLRRAQILKGLSEALAGISLSAEGGELEQQAAAAAQKLAPLLALKNSPSTPAIHLIGHAHIDHAWLWPIAETERKAARTFSNMLKFINEYPEFVFIQSQPCQLEIMKNEYPDIFEGIRKAYKSGNWEPNGGMWVEADCNIPSGESLIRQFLVGKKVNKELLNHEADTLWLPDVFGYSAALPQILAGCRIKYFVTSKMSWNDTTRFPYDTFIWRGIDGTGVKVHLLLTGYNGRAAPADIAAAWNLIQHKEVQSACIAAVGEGDGGGGTLRADLEITRRLNDLEGFPRSAWKTAGAALDEIFSAGDFPVWRGELYLELHRGTYTTQGRTKRNNRKLEYSLRGTELYCALAALDGKGGYPCAELLDCWKNTLTNQFHDIIPGSSITRVYAEAEEISARMLDTLKGLSSNACIRLAGLNENGSGSTVFVFNDLSWERKGAVSITAEKIGGALADADGTTYPVQRYTAIDGQEQAVFAPKIPSLGWARFNIISGSTDAKSPFVRRGNTLETPFYAITFDANGGISSLIDRRQNREMAAPGGAFNAFITAEDIPVLWDAWDIDADWVKHVQQDIRFVSAEVAADGPVCFRLRSRYEIGKGSRLVQDMVCYAEDPRIDFETKVEWHENRRLLKVEFDTVVDAAQVRCEIQYGHLLRNTHRNLMHDRAKFEICAHKWISLEEEGSGIALLNDCKYGHDVEGGRMRLTLLRSPAAPDPEADRGVHYFTYAILPFAGAFGSSAVIQSAYELNSPAVAFTGAPETGSPARQSFCSVDGSQVIIESVKLPENGADDELILRLYECLGGRSRSTLRFSRELHFVAETDMLEENPQPLTVQGKNIDLEFRPFEIKTLRVKFR